MNQLLHGIVQVLYEIAIGHGNVTKGFSLFSISPRELVSTSFRLKDIPSSVLVVEERDDAPDLLTFVQETLGGLAEVLSNNNIMFTLLYTCLHRTFY